ncbi:RNA cap guanine-N2 methyltransferase-domain-containing protein [Melampsora americana]|nr:RNA cap guanine-N2 methyltransferase-domain-containing protein [Melampsora americana]
MKISSNFQIDWYQRNRLFWRFDEGIKLDQQSWYSVTPEGIARQIAERCRLVIVDAFCGAGGNAIQFASTSDKVIAIDIDPNKIGLAKHNATVYGVEDKIEFICTDFVEWIQNQEQGSVDVIFLSPPWGGVNYLSFNSPTKSQAGGSTGFYPLTELQPIPGKELFSLASKVTPNIALYLPRNLDLQHVAGLVDDDVQIEVEEAWMTSKCKAVTVYFGNLVAKTNI